MVLPNHLKARGLSLKQNISVKVMEIPASILNKYIIPRELKNTIDNS